MRWTLRVPHPAAHRRAARNDGKKSLPACGSREHGLPIVPRGAGTGLSGGSLPVEGGIVIGTSRMTRILDVDFSPTAACAFSPA